MKQEFARSEYSQARALVMKYRCATCWGPLVERIVTGGGSVVECVKDDADCDKTGFVTHNYVERRHAEDHGDAHEARQNLPFLQPAGATDPDQIIRDIRGE